MYVGTLSTRELVSLALMILFTMALMFFLGYKYSYDKAITYANEQIEEKVNDFKMDQGIINREDNMDFILGNRELPDFGGIEDE